jgi:signal transduction histidine kinase
VIHMGLRVRVAASFVLVTLGAVLVVEALLIGFFTPPVIGAQVNERDQINAVRTEAAHQALKLSGQLSTNPEPPEVKPSPGATPTCTPADRSGALTLLLAADGRVLLSSVPGCYPVGGGFAGAPPAADLAQASGGGKVPGGPVVWATQPVVRVPADEFPPGETDPAALLRLPKAQPVGKLYVQLPLRSEEVPRLGNVRPLLLPGLVVLAAALPVGLLFGYVSMQRPVRRLRRLADTTAALADGDLDRRVPVRGRDELSRLEASVNRMAEQLSLALAAERDLAGAHARATERARIARELHDSVSQELFSLRLLAGGIHRALPADSPLRAQVESMARSAGTATREMRALLLELRPAALAGTGLAGALDQLAAAYRTRLGVDVRTELDDVALPPDQEHALLRIAQEALANALRHGDPTRVTVTLRPGLLRIADNGSGFDLGAPALVAGATGMGLGLMRERAAEIGVSLTITSAPGQGTAVEVTLP